MRTRTRTRTRMRTVHRNSASAGLNPPPLALLDHRHQQTVSRERSLESEEVPESGNARGESGAAGGESGGAGGEVVGGGSSEELVDQRERLVRAEGQPRGRRKQPIHRFLRRPPLVRVRALAVVGRGIPPPAGRVRGVMRPVGGR